MMPCLCPSDTNLLFKMAFHRSWSEKILWMKAFLTRRTSLPETNYWHSLLKSVTEVAYYKLYFELRQIMWKPWPVNEISISCFEGAFECDMFWGFPCLSWQLLPAKQISLFSFFLKIFFNASMVIMCWNWFLFFFFFIWKCKSRRNALYLLWIHE